MHAAFERGQYHVFDVLLARGNISSVSVRKPAWVAGLSRISRKASPKGVPPGSR